MNIIIPLTTQLKVWNYPYTCLIEPSSINGLSALRVGISFQIVALDKKRLEKTFMRLRLMGVFLSCSNDINPHTREGCDKPVIDFYPFVFYFNPHTREGCDL